MNQSVALQLTGGGLAHMLSDVLQPASQTVVAGTFYTAYMGLFTAWPGFSFGLQTSQLTEANYGGYARQRIVWGDTGIDALQRPEVFGGSLQFQPTTSAISNTVIGAFVADAAVAGNLLAVGLLTTSVVLGTPVNTLILVPRFAVPGTITPIDWGEVVGIF